MNPVTYTKVRNNSNPSMQVKGNNWNLLRRQNQQGTPLVKQNVWTNDTQGSKQRQKT